MEQGQTLYAISRTFAVEVDDIVKANPAAATGLSIGQELLIPSDAVNKREARKAPELVADGELLHTVAKKETLFGIARNYNMDVNVLLDRNPELSAGLREGQKIIIPVQKTAETSPATRPAIAERILEHIVRPGETLYSLGKLYVVSPEAIQAVNDGLKEGLKAGMTVKIPLRIGTEPPKPSVSDSSIFSHRYKIALLLPFALGRNDSLLAATSGTPMFYEPSRIAAQFYGGARIALDSLEELGLHADVIVLDQGDEARIWDPVLKRPEIKEMDLFIGPFHRTAIEQLVKINSTAHIVCPVPQTGKLLVAHPTISKVTPARSDLMRRTAHYVAGRAQENIILLKPDIATDKEMQDQMQRALQENLNDQPVRLRDSVLVFTSGRKDLSGIVSKLDLARLNVIVAPSADVEFVSLLVNTLRSQVSKYRIQLIGLEEWLKFE
ncbi:MAG: LysM peptidoglycan-binding domain-containing protein, partial [Bacteroidota bacterium]|nr:LysM peptidoglycan-binding domain-containing protein [Bacteroidota bacterium]